MNLLHTIELYNESGIIIPLDKNVVRNIVSLISEEEKCDCSFLEVVFVDAEEIVQVNNEHLGHDYVTDVISFSYLEKQKESKTVIDGTLYCCAQRIGEQAEEWNEKRETEFRRIIIHGILHLIGYEDATPAQKEIMHNKENLYLNRLGTLHEN